MVATRRPGNSVAGSLRDHVLGPVSTAEATVATELAEVEAEREAFEAFRDRVANIDTVSISGSTPTSRPRGIVESRPGCAHRVRDAFRETVMSVDHYDEYYGESVEKHFAAELSPELLPGILEDGNSPFTDPYKRALLGAVDIEVDQFETYCDTIEDERASLETSAAELEALLDLLDGTRVPARARTDFIESLEDVAHWR